MTVSALATRIGWERSRASHHAKRMAGRGLVTMRQWERDRRSTAVAMTDGGRDVLRQATPSHVEMVKRMFFGQLPSEQLPGFAGTLEQIYESVLEHGTLPRPEDHP